MKKIILSCLAACALFHTANAQLTEKQLKAHQKEVAKSKQKNSVVWSLDTIFNNGLPYCIMKKKNKSFFGGYEGDFYALNGKNAFYAKTMTELGLLTREITILATGQKAYLDGDLEKGIVEAELFTGDSLNETAVHKFVMLHAQKPENKLVQVADRVGLGDKNKESIATTDNNDEAASAQPVRNRQAIILIFGDDAQQDFKRIGKIKQIFGVPSTDMLYEVLDVTGRRIADVEGKIHGTSWKVVTLKNNKIHTVSCEKFKEKETIMLYLTELRYL
jgi:hypothetical protein